MRASTLIFSFLGILLLTGTSRYKQTQKSNDQRESSISPWGEPSPPQKEEMLQEQEEEEDRYDVDDSTDDEDEVVPDEEEKNGAKK
jgi:hypothetical protein